MFTSIENELIAKVSTEQEVICRMQKSWDALLTKKIVGLVFDVDHNLTLPGSKQIAPEAFTWIFNLRQRGLPVMLDSGRRYKDPQTGEYATADMAQVAVDFRKFLVENNIEITTQQQVLDGLFIASEGGLQICNAFFEQDAFFHEYTDALLQTLGVIRNPTKETDLFDFLANLDFSIIDPGFARVPKKMMYTYRHQNHDRLLDLKEHVIQELKNASLWDSQIKIFVGRIGLDVVFYPFGKEIAHRFFQDILQIPINEGSLIAAWGDAGEVGGNDNPMLQGRLGGLSTDRYDPTDLQMICLPLLGQHQPGLKSVLWSLEQMKHSGCFN